MLFATGLIETWRFSAYRALSLFLLLFRHDAVIKVLRDRGATLVLTGNDAGVLMCEVSFYFSLILNSFIIFKDF